MPGMNSIHERLKHARIHAGHRSAYQFAVKHGMVVPTYSSHENGTRGLTLNTVRRYSKILGISEYWLLTGQGPMQEKREEKREEEPRGLEESKAPPFEGGRFEASKLEAGRFQATKLAPPPLLIKTSASIERKLHRAAYQLAKEALLAKYRVAYHDEVNELAWQMVDMAKAYGEKSLNAALANWLASWKH